ncbi:MAG: hypothetical protein P8017_15250 [Deltaproteobacteria bacterium]|jgi:hypothetical protein
MNCFRLFSLEEGWKFSGRTQLAICRPPANSAKAQERCAGSGVARRYQLTQLNYKEV